MPKIVEAADIMEKARTWFGTDIFINPAKAQKLLGDLDVKLVMFVHGFQKRVKTRKPYNSMEEIAHDLVREVRQNGGVLDGCPWEVPADKPAASAQQATAVQQAAFAPGGYLDTQQLEDVFGYKLGSRLQLKVSKKKMKICKPSFTLPV